jgi:hypothetical protein
VALAVGEVAGELARQVDLILDAQLTWKPEVGADVQAAVLPFVEVSRVPEGRRLVVGPQRHLIRLGVDRRIAVQVFFSSRVM